MGENVTGCQSKNTSTALEYQLVFISNVAECFPASGTLVFLCSLHVLLKSADRSKAVQLLWFCVLPFIGVPFGAVITFCVCMIKAILGKTAVLSDCHTYIYSYHILLAILPAITKKLYV